MKKPARIQVVQGPAAAREHPDASAPSEKLRALQILAEATASLPRDPEVEEWLGRFLATLIRLTDAAAGAVRLVSEDARHLRLVASAGLPADVVARERLMPFDCGACGVALQMAEVNRTASPSTCSADTSLEWFRGFGGMIMVPLAHQGKVLGVYNLFFSEERRLTDDVALLYRSIGEHLGLALENARLARENLRMTVMNERQLMANEVHDSLAQTMAYMKMRLALLLEALHGSENERALKYAGYLQTGLAEAYSDLRELLAQFRSRMDPLGLVHALEALAGSFEDRTGVRLTIENRLPELALSANAEANVLHILQEGLANVARHSGARQARVLLERVGGDYAFSVEDDGSGFFTLGGRPGGAGATGNLRHHLGVSIMRERAEHLDGHIEIANLPQGGARVRLVFPAAPEKPESAA